MQARFLDGRSARAHAAEVSVEDGDLCIVVGGEHRTWSLKGLSIERQGGEARLSHRSDRDARLVLAEADWNALGASHAALMEPSGRRREVALVGGLTAVALGVVAFVFWGVPALSGPLARVTPVGFEQRMGQNLDIQMNLVFRRCDGEAGQATLHALGQRIASVSETPFDIRVRAVQAPMANAFALPGGVVLVTDDLIREADDPDELAAVVAHEVAHVEKRHVMQAVWRSLGIGLILDAVVGGGSGAGQQAVILAGQATDLRYGREAEIEADTRGQDILHALGLSSTGMARFFERMATHTGSETAPAAELLSTHPDTLRRVRAARAGERSGEAALSEAQWRTVQEACGAASEGPIERIERRFGRRGDNATVDQGDQVRQD